MICISNRHHAIVVPCPGNHFITFLSSVATNKQNESDFWAYNLDLSFIKHTTIQSVYQSFDTTRAIGNNETSVLVDRPHFFHPIYSNILTFH